MATSKKNYGRKYAKRAAKKAVRKIPTPVLFVCVLLLAAIAVGIYLFRDNTEEPAPVYIPPEGELSIHAIDVGQGDSILVRAGGEVMLIDTGDKKTAHHEAIVSYLEKQGISAIDYLILTHPDADHIGGAPTVIRSFTVKNCVMPDAEATSGIFSDTLDALEETNVNVIEAKAGENFSIGTAACRILSPIKEKYGDVNSYSVVIRLVFGDRTALFTGDATFESEEAIMDRFGKTEVKAELLKVGHHGSDTSSSEEWLAYVSPSYALISVGEGNIYKHPCKVTLDHLEDAGVAVYRTDLCGSIVFTTDGTAPWQVTTE